MSYSEHFRSNVDSRECRINYSFNCDSSYVVYLLECTVCGLQYVGSTCTPFRLKFDNYKACSRNFNSGASVPQAEFFRHFTEEGYQGFLTACVKCRSNFCRSPRQVTARAKRS